MSDCSALGVTRAEIMVAAALCRVPLPADRERSAGRQAPFALGAVDVLASAADKMPGRTVAFYGDLLRLLASSCH